MGMFDYLYCDLPMPDGRRVLKDSFQTKSLWCSMGHFTITATGRLIHNQRRYSLVSDADAGEPAHVADIDMEYHGDVEIHGETPAGDSACYVVRFTHGTVEWIRNLETLPEIHRQWLMARG